MSDTTVLRTLLFVALCCAGTATLAESLDDPMRPPQLAGGAKKGTSAAAEQVPLVSSIIIAPGRRSAVVGGKSVGVGDRVNGMEVVAIEPAAVTVRHSGKLQRLPFHSINIKTPSQVSPP